MKVIITQAAERDLSNIQDFIALDSPKRAISFTDELLEQCNQLADMSMAFPLVKHYEKAGIRRRPHGKYLIFYRIRGDIVEIIHILNGARDYEAFLSAEDE